MTSKRRWVWFWWKMYEEHSQINSYSESHKKIDLLATETASRNFYNTMQLTFSHTHTRLGLQSVTKVKSNWRTTLYAVVKTLNIFFNDVHNKARKRKLNFWMERHQSLVGTFFGYFKKGDICQKKKKPSLFSFRSSVMIINITLYLNAYIFQTSLLFEKTLCKNTPLFSFHRES